VHVYGSASAGLKNFTITGNTVVNSGQGDGMDYQVGGGAPVVNLVFTNNMNYRNSDRRGNVLRLGYNWGPTNSGATVTGNYMVGKTLLSYWSSIDWGQNSIVAFPGPAVTVMLQDGGSMPKGSWSSNSYYSKDAPLVVTASSGNTSYSLDAWRQKTGLDGSSSNSTAMPSGTKVVVEPNKYEAGRANVIVYNWSGQGAVSVDLSKVLRLGDEYEVRSAQNYFGSPVASGTYGGGSVSIPVVSGSSASSITGKSMSSTGSQFAAYVVLLK